MPGSRLLVQPLVFPVPVPLSARWTGNDIGETTTFKQMLAGEELLSTDTLLADEACAAAELLKKYGRAGGW